MKRNRDNKKVIDENYGVLSLGLALIAIALTVLYFATWSWGTGIQHKWIMDVLPVLLVLGVICGVVGKSTKYGETGLTLNVVGLAPIIMMWIDMW